MRTKAIITCALALLVSAAQPALAAPATGAVCEASSVQGQDARVAITTGVERDRVWLEAQYEGLRINKFTRADGASVTEFRFGSDKAVVSVAPGTLSVTAAGKTITVDPQGGDQSGEIQALLGRSRSITKARTMLSRLEQESALKAPEMSLLSSVAFVAALLGDTRAPERLGNRFGAIHHGIMKVALARESCWTSYSTEVLAAQDDYSSCLVEAYQGSIWLRDFREFACDATWLLRAESAWFEFLKCTSPLSIVRD